MIRTTAFLLLLPLGLLAQNSLTIDSVTFRYGGDPIFGQYANQTFTLTPGGDNRIPYIEPAANAFEIGFPQVPAAPVVSYSYDLDNISLGLGATGPLTIDENDTLRVSCRVIPDDNTILGTTIARGDVPKTGLRQGSRSGVEVPNTENHTFQFGDERTISDFTVECNAIHTGESLLGSASVGTATLRFSVVRDLAPPTPTSDIDLQVAQVEVIQVMQTNNHDIPLVADKESLIRVVPLAAAPAETFPRSPLAEVNVRIRLSRDGIAPFESTGTFEIVSFVSTSRLPLGSDELYAFRNGQISFVLDPIEFPVPTAFTVPGTVNITATIDPGGDFDESDEDNNSFERTANFVERDILAIGYLEFCGASACPNADEGSLILRRQFPIAETRGLAYFPLESSVKSGCENNEESTPASLLKCVARHASLVNDGLLDLIAVISSDQLIGADSPSGVVARFITNNRLLVVDGNSPQVGVAKQALQFFRGGQHHTADECAQRIDNRFPTQVHFDFDSRSIVPLQFDDTRIADVQGPALCTLPDWPQGWIRGIDYDELFFADFVNPAQFAAVNQVAPRNLVLVSGDISGDGTASLDPVLGYSATTSTPVTSAAGDTCVELSSDSGAVSRHCFDGQLRADEVAPFAFVLDDPGELNRVALVRSGSSVASRTRSGSAPQVVVTAPAVGSQVDSTQPVTISWTADDPDGDSLEFAALYSFNQGETWLTLGAGITGNSITFDPAILFSPGEILLKVIATDGLRSHEVVHGPVTLLQTLTLTAPAEVDIGAATAGSSTEGGVPLTATGTGPVLVEQATFSDPRFELASGLPFQVSVESPRNLLVRFRPDSTAERTADLTLTTDSPTNPTVVVRVRARGTDPNLGSMTVSASSLAGLSFGAVAEGSTATAEIEVANNGGAAFNYTPRVTGEGFSLGPVTKVPTGNFPAQTVRNLEPGERERVTVSFSPQRMGAFTGALEIAGTAPNLPQTVIPLSGQTPSAAGGGQPGPGGGPPPGPGGGPPPPPPAGGTPMIAQGGIVDAASFGQFVGLGGIASLFGTNLADGVDTARSIPLPRTLQGTEVLVGGVPAPLFFVSDRQINFQVPFEMSARTGQFQVRRGGSTSPAVLAAVTTYAPAFFADPATGLVSAVDNASGAVIDFENPASAGDVISVFFTGVGDVSNAPGSGEAAPSSALSVAMAESTVTLGGLLVPNVFFVGLTPGLVGLNQLTFEVPDLTAATLAKRPQQFAGSLPLTISFFRGFGTAMPARLAVDLPTAPPPPVDGVDLGVLIVRATPREIAAGGSLSLAFRVESSNSPVPSRFTWEVFVSSDARIDPSEDLLIGNGEEVFFELNGIAWNWEQGITIPSGLAPGSYYLGVRIEYQPPVNASPNERQDVNPANDISPPFPIVVAAP